MNNGERGVMTMSPVVFMRKSIVTPQRIDKMKGNWLDLAFHELQQYLPACIIDVTGTNSRVSAPARQGYCSQVVFLDSECGKYALKIAEPGYRGEELHAEYLTLKLLEGRGLPIPKAYAYTADERGHYLLSSYCEGTPLSELLKTEDECERLNMVAQMAEVLVQIHSNSIEIPEWAECLESQLAFAHKHLEHENIDLDEFVGDNGERLQPAEVLSWLVDNKPAAGRVCLLHGDYRPKNMLWKDNGISCVLDWAFCDIGDPYYDLAIVWYYLKTTREKEHFLRCYGLEQLDEARLEYFEVLAKFINV